MYFTPYFTPTSFSNRHFAVLTQIAFQSCNPPDLVSLDRDSRIANRHSSFTQAILPYPPSSPPWPSPTTTKRSPTTRLKLHTPWSYTWSLQISTHWATRLLATSSASCEEVWVQGPFYAIPYFPHFRKACMPLIALCMRPLSITRHAGNLGHEKHIEPGWMSAARLSKGMLPYFTCSRYMQYADL